jgi:DNA-binding NarL/FixJ family response regulator
LFLTSSFFLPECYVEPRAGTPILGDSDFHVCRAQDTFLQKICSLKDSPDVQNATHDPSCFVYLCVCIFHACWIASAEIHIANLRLLLSDDHNVVRVGLRCLLGGQPGWEVVAEASDGREGTRDTPRRGIARHRNAGSKRFGSSAPDSSGLATHENPDAHRAVHADDTFFTAKVADIILASFKTNGANEAYASHCRLTPRQSQLVQLLADGLSSKGVAALLNISIKTAETHRANLMRRLNCHSVAEIVRYITQSDH